jgi:hypothetical protein
MLLVYEIFRVPFSNQCKVKFKCGNNINTKRTLFVRIWNWSHIYIYIMVHSSEYLNFSDVDIVVPIHKKYEEYIDVSHFKSQNHSKRILVPEK